MTKRLISRLLTSLFLSTSILIYPTLALSADPPTATQSDVEFPNAINDGTLSHIQAASFMLYVNGQPDCSATFINPTEMVTASHCVIDLAFRYSIVVQHANSVEIFDVMPKSVNKQYDTASLVLVDKSAAFPYVKVATDDTKLNAGDDLISVSYPSVMGYAFIVKGTYNGLAETPNGLTSTAPSYSVSIDTAPGSSGGGLYAFLEGQWELIGMTEGGPPQHDYISFFSTLSGLKEVM